MTADPKGAPTQAKDSSARRDLGNKTSMAFSRPARRVSTAPSLLARQCSPTPLGHRAAPSAGRHTFGTPGSSGRGAIAMQQGAGLINENRRHSLTVEPAVASPRTHMRRNSEPAGTAAQARLSRMARFLSLETSELESCLPRVHSLEASQWSASRQVASAADSSSCRPSAGNPFDEQQSLEQQSVDFDPDDQEAQEPEAAPEQAEHAEGSGLFIALGQRCCDATRGLEPTSPTSGKTVEDLADSALEKAERLLEELRKLDLRRDSSPQWSACSTPSNCCTSVRSASPFAGRGSSPSTPWSTACGA
eukprot:CAMPEP_0115048918 /NCGR_PEP_ID=MMETSP0227-20121206/876_1 /TAXON_ID=89957 /ORGANISM="Polarella glacialis, Strain CCMP 1383" /LENGTH=304 /DNA_ID=CAMNT_0002432477 /DNA_START=37 /DNA_END=952 /DNA_ORIENTATION=-